MLDVGCGRGEFLQLLREHGISGRGVDLNHEMVAECRAAGLEAEEADAVSYMTGLPDGSLGGLMAAQVVEHLEPDYLLRLLDEAFRVLRPDSPIALETINVTSWSAFFTSYLRDLTHVRPDPPRDAAVHRHGVGLPRCRDPVPSAAARFREAPVDAARDASSRSGADRPGGSRAARPGGRIRSERGTAEHAALRAAGLRGHRLAALARPLMAARQDGASCHCICLLPSALRPAASISPNSTAVGKAGMARQGRRSESSSSVCELLATARTGTPIACAPSNVVRRVAHDQRL